MSTSNMQEEMPKLGIGWILSRSLSIVFSKFFIFLGLTILLVSPLLLVSALAFILGRGGTEVFYLIVLLLLVIPTMIIIQGSVTLVAFKTLRSEPVHVISILRLMASRLLPFLGTCFLFAIVIGFPALTGSIAALLLGAPAYLLLLIGSVIVLCLFYTTIPACLVERLGPLESLQRAAFLSKNYRGSIFILIILTVLISVALELILSLVAAVGAEIPVLGFVITMVAFVVTVVFGQAFGSSVVAVTYFQLRNLKEGVDIDKLVNVFD